VFIEGAGVPVPWHNGTITSPNLILCCTLCVSAEMLVTPGMEKSNGGNS